MGAFMNGDQVLILSDKRWIDARKVFPILAAMFSTLLLVALLAVIAIFPDIPWQRIPARLVEQIGTVDWGRAIFRSLEAVVILCVAVLQIYYSIRANRLERLVLSREGVRYVSPLPPFLKRFRPDWYLAWDQVSKAELVTLARQMNNPEFILITLTAGSEKRQLFPVRWVDPEKYSSPVFKFTLSFKRQSNDEMLKAVMDSDIMRFISASVPQVAVNPALSAAEIHTSLEKNPHGRIAMGIIFLLIAYAVIDFMAGPDAYVDAPSSLFHIYVSTAIAGAILSGIWLYKSTLIVQEKIGLAILIGAIAGVAMIPGALRINTFSGSEAAGTYDYFVVQGADSVVLKPVVEGMPVIDYFAKNRFWGKFGKDDTYPVQLRKGILGFYQFKLSPILQDIRRYEGK